MESLPNEIISEIQKYLKRDDLFNFRVLSKLFAESPIHIDHMINIYRRRHRAKYIHTLSLINDICYAVDPNSNLSHRKINDDNVFYKIDRVPSSILGVYTNKKPKGEYSKLTRLPFTTQYNGCMNRYQFRMHETRNDTKFLYLLRPRVKNGPNVKLHICVKFGYV